MFAALMPYKWIIIGSLLLTIVGGAVLYFKTTQSKIESQASELASANIIIEQQQHIISQQAEDYARQKILNEELRKKFIASRNQVEILRRKFNKTNKLIGQRDIGKLAEAKPKLIEKIVNNGTADALRCMEIASGAPLTEHEKEATKKSEINKSCPDLANPNYVPY